MKRIFSILCICFCVIPLFAFPTSAASYDLGTPKLFYYTKPSGIDVDVWPYYTAYLYDSATDTVDFHVWGISPSIQLDYYLDYRSVYEDYFHLGSYIASEDLSRHIYVSGYDSRSRTLKYANTGNVRNKLLFNNLVWENLLLPFNGQYLRIDASFDSALIQAPQAILDVFTLNDLCYLCDTSGRDGYPDRYSLPIVYPSTATVTKVGNVYSYSFFFNLSNIALSSLADSDNVCLALRIPYYFNNAASFEGGVEIYSNANIPLSYEILTIGGYDQALSDIKNSVDTLKTHLLDFYTYQDRGDVAFISNANTVFDDGKNVVNDYNNANVKIQQVVTGAVIPDMQDIIDDQVGLTGDILDPVKEIFQNTYVVSAFLICFAFCLISVLLYGIRG